MSHIQSKQVTNGNTHDHSGGDGAAITDAALSFTDVTTNDVSITKHGFAPKAPNDTSKFLRGDGTWNAPAGTGAAFPVGSVFIAVVATDPSVLLGYGTWVAFGAGRVLIGIDAGDADFNVVEETGGAKTSTPSAHADTAVANHDDHVHSGPTTHSDHVHSGSATHDDHTHTYTQVPNHVHVQNIPSSFTGSQAYLATDTSTTGSTASVLSTANPTGGVATGTTSAEVADLTHGNTGNNTTALTHGNTGNPTAALTHSVTQPSAHAAMSVVQPYIVVYMWKRTA